MVSNKSLALLIVAAVVISLGGTIISLNMLEEKRAQVPYSPPISTGHVTSAGQVNLSISSNASCRIETNVSFGSGSQPTSTTTLSSDLVNSFGFSDCTNAAGTNNCKGLEINNTGNTNLNVSFSSNANATTLLGSQTGLDLTDFVFYSRNGTYANTTQGCLNVTGANLSGIYQSTNLLLCRNFSYLDGNDLFTMEFNITLEPDIAPGTKQAIVTVTCETV